MIEVTSTSQLKNLLEEHNKTHIFLLKHSTRCPGSAMAFAQFERFSGQHTAIACALIKVIEYREVSDLLAEVSGVAHQSPQAILFFQGEMLWADSHSAIQEDTLKSLIRT